MLRLSVSDFLRYLWRNIITALLMAILCLVVVCLCTLFRIEYGKYKPFHELSKKADYYIMNRMAMSNTEFDFVEEMYTAYKGRIELNGEILWVYIYDSWVYENWSPRLRSGKWLSEEDTGPIRLVLGGIADNHVPGEQYRLPDYQGGAEVTVVGVLQPETEILWSDVESFNSADDLKYDMRYAPPEINTSSGLYGIISKQDADRYGIDYSQTGAWMIYQFREGLNAEEREAAQLRLYEESDRLGRTMEDFMEVSTQRVLERVGGYLPLAGMAILLILCILYATSLIYVRESSPIYAVYYLSGAAKRTCYVISMGNAIGTIGLSVLFYLVLASRIRLYMQEQNIAFDLKGTGMFAAMLYVGFAVCMMLNQCLCMRKRSPLQVFRNNRG